MTITTGRPTQKKARTAAQIDHIVMDNNTVSDEIQCIINRNWGIIQSNTSYMRFFKNLQCELLKGSHAQGQSWEKLFACYETDNEVSASQIYLIRSFINWKSTYVIYRLHSPCNHFSGGETKHRLRDWLWDHKNAICTRNILLNGSASCVILIHKL